MQYAHWVDMPYPHSKLIQDLPCNYPFLGNLPPYLNDPPPLIYPCSMAQITILQDLFSYVPHKGKGGSWIF